MFKGTSAEKRVSGTVVACRVAPRDTYMTVETGDGNLVHVSMDRTQFDALGIIEGSDIVIGIPNGMIGTAS